MIYQEDIMLYFDEISRKLREDDIPIFNNIIMDYPGFPSKEDIYNEESDYEESDYEDNYIEDN